MKRVLLALLILSPPYGHAQPAPTLPKLTTTTKVPKVPKMPAEELVDCRSLKGLSSAILRNLGSDVRCRLERRDVTCLPGLTVSKNSTGDIDLCVTAEKRPVTTPYCVAKNTQLYTQKLIERGRFVVDEPDGTVQVRWLDIPFSKTGRKEILVQREPIVRRGWDVCVYLRKEVLYLLKKHHGPMPTPKRAVKQAE
jgi:hypothetical protein